MSEPRHYCSTCLTSLVGGEARCPRAGCERPRPPGGWPRYLQPGEVVGDRYAIRGRLGAGGAGITYRALDLRAPRGTSPIVALKLLHQDRLHGVLRERLRLEGQVLRHLRHPGIVAYRDLKADGEGPAWLATAWVPGGSLDRRLRRSGPLGADEVLEIGRQIALALAYAHERGVVHRDLKPANVLIASESPLRVVIADFGIARAPRDAARTPRPPLTALGDFIGTPEFAAPEQHRGDAVGPPADVFALGMMLHVAGGGEPLRASLLPGRLDGARLRAADAPLRRTPLARLREPEGDWRAIDRLVDALLRADPAERPDAAEVARRCADMLLERSPPRPTVVVPDAAPEPAAARRAAPVPGAGALIAWRPLRLPAPASPALRALRSGGEPAALLSWRPARPEPDAG